MQTFSTYQEVFDAVYLGLASQDFKPSADDNGACYYRSNDGCKCAAGHVIPDDLYAPSMENRKFGTICYKGEIPGNSELSLASALFPGTGFAQRETLIDFLGMLQSVHDHSVHHRREGFDKRPETEAAILKNGLEAFAGAHGLTIPEIPTKES